MKTKKSLLKLYNIILACATDKTEPWLLKSVCEAVPNSLFWPPQVYQDLSTSHNRPVKKDIVHLPIRMKENFETHFQ